MKTVFDEDRFRSAYPEGIEFHWWQQARCAIIARELRRIARPDLSVLDVGCGRGIEVSCLRGRGVDCLGVERSVTHPLPGMEEHIRYGMDARDLPAELRARCGSLLLLDVIEHLDDPADFLADLVRSFPHLSSVLLTVPARQELWSNYDVYYGHQRRYTPEMIAGLAHTLGWNIAGIRYFFHSPYLAARIAGFLGVERTRQISAPSGVLRRLHRAAARILSAEARVVPGRCPGTSLIAVLELPHRDDAGR